jgi:hypothetical protein
MRIKELIQRLIQRLRALFGGRPASPALESAPARAALPTAAVSAAAPTTATTAGAATTTPAAGATTAPFAPVDAAPAAGTAQVAAPARRPEPAADATPPMPLRAEQRADAATATTPEADAPQRPRLRLVEGKRSTKRQRAFPALDPAIAAVPVRRFFSRLVARDAAPLTAASWPSLQVERFFLALAEPSPAIRRGPAIAEPKVLEEAFADFVWE